VERRHAKYGSGRLLADAPRHLLLLAVTLVKASGDDDQHFVAKVAVVFEALKQLKPSARARRRPTGS